MTVATKKKLKFAEAIKKHVDLPHWEIASFRFSHFREIFCHKLLLILKGTVMANVIRKLIFIYNKVRDNWTNSRIYYKISVITS